MRRSAKQSRLTASEAQLLQLSYAEALALPPSGGGNAELCAEFTSASEQLKQTPNKSLRP
jgi:hypothetical protein